MRPLIGITGEKKPASTLVDVLDVLRAVDIDVYYGDYARAVQRAGGIPVWIPADVGPEVLERLDGLLLSGGDDIDPAEFGHEPDPALGNTNSQRDAHERGLLDAALATDLPVLGVCRGAQMMNVHLGGTLHQHLPAHVEPSGDPAATHHCIAFAPGSVAHAVYGDEIEVNSLHHQGIDQLGNGVIPVGRTVGGPDDGLVEAVEVDGKTALGVQWHPELLGGVDPAVVWLVEQAVSVNS